MVEATNRSSITSPRSWRSRIECSGGRASGTWAAFSSSSATWSRSGRYFPRSAIRWPCWRAGAIRGSASEPRPFSRRVRSAGASERVHRGQPRSARQRAGSVPLVRIQSDQRDHEVSHAAQRGILAARVPVVGFFGRKLREFARLCHWQSSDALMHAMLVACLLVPRACSPGFAFAVRCDALQRPAVQARHVHSAQGMPGSSWSQVPRAPVALELSRLTAFAQERVHERLLGRCRGNDTLLDRVLGDQSIYGHRARPGRCGARDRWPEPRRRGSTRGRGG